MQPAPVIEGKALVSGKAVVLSDVVGVPDVPITEGTIVSIPEERFNSFANEVQLQAGSSLLIREMALSYVAASSLLGQQGEFELEMVPGAYVLCYLSHSISAEAVRLEACAKTNLDAGERLSIRVETMFGSYIVGNGVEMIPLDDIYPLESNSSDTSAWQTYRNKEYKIEFQYPNYCMDYIGPGFFSVSCRQKDISFKIAFIFNYFAYYGDIQCDTIKDCLKEFNLEGEVRSDTLAFSEYTSEGSKGLALLFILRDTPLGDGMGELYVIEDVAGKENTLYLQTAHQILATFRFVS